MTRESAHPGVRVAEVLAALSLVTDLARGHPPEEAMRACLVAVHLGHRVGLHVSAEYREQPRALPESDLFNAYHATLLRFVGCTAASTAYASGFAGDDVDVRRAGDLMGPTEALGFLWTLSRKTGATRPLQFARMLSHAPTLAREGAAADCEVGSQLVARFGFSPALQTALLHSFERWDGHGAPHGTKGGAMPLPSRLATLAFAAVMFDAVAGRTAAVQTVRRASGRIIDPSLAHVFLQAPDEHLDAASPDDAWEAVVAVEPGQPRLAGDETLEGDRARISGRGRPQVAISGGPLVGRGAVGEARWAQARPRQGTDQDAPLAGLLHDIGRVGIATGVWDKPARLTRADWEEVRLHPYHTQRILSRVPALTDVARVAAQHHERLSGGRIPRWAGPPVARRLATSSCLLQQLGTIRLQGQASTTSVPARS